MADAEADWNAYFENIKEVCPWSWSAWQQGAIQVTAWYNHVENLEHNQARLYIAHKHKPRQLKKIAQRLNRTRPEEEWLWSHPKFEFYSTPVPTLIQQDRHKLEKARKNLKNKGFVK